MKGPIAVIVTCAFLGLANAQSAPLEDARYRPGKFKVAWIESPNFNNRPGDTLVDTIVLHHTAGPTTASCVRWFENTESQVSAHYVVGKDGSIISMVNPFYRAWHGGASKDPRGKENLNNFSVGIEIVNVGNGKDPYTPDQVMAVRLLCGYLCRYKYRNQIVQILSHEYIAVPPGRKNDPINYPWESLYDVADELGVKLVYGRADKTPTNRVPVKSQN